jgi:uncharacterized protein (DUF885 family)
MPRFADFVDKYMEFNWKTSPISATFAGIHKYDHELDNVKEDFISDVNEQRKEHLSELERIPEKELTAEEHIDWRLLKNEIKSAIRDTEEIQFWKTRAAVYPELCSSFSLENSHHSRNVLRQFFQGCVRCHVCWRTA